MSSLVFLPAAKIIIIIRDNFRPTAPKKLAQFNIPAEFTLGYCPNRVVKARVMGGG